MQSTRHPHDIERPYGHGEEGGAWLPPQVKANTCRYAWWARLRPICLDADLKRSLTDRYFRDEILQLETMLSCDLSRWVTQ